MRRARPRVSRSLSGRSLLHARSPWRSWIESDVERVKREVRERDRYTCRICGEPGKTVHHVDYDQGNNDKSNLVTLCRLCHPKTNSDRDRWQQYFAQLEALRCVREEEAGI